jgi:hypothetical protein
MVVATDDRDAVIISKALKKLLTKGKETLFWKTIVFQNDCFVHVGKHPVQSTGNPAPSAHVCGCEVCFDLTRPIDRVNDSPACLDKLGFAELVGSWAIAHDKELSGSRPTNLLKNLPRLVGTIEHDEGDRSLATHERT